MIKTKAPKFEEFLIEALNEVAKKGDSKEYKAFFKKTLKKYGADEVTDLSTEDKKKFFDEIDNGWKSDEEED